MSGSVTVGAIYSRCDAPHLRWVVVATTEIDGIGHVYLQRLGDPSDVKLLAANAVTDEHEYHRVSSVQSNE
ncbi:MAG: hypothetical protein HQL37_08955 [Alphaproteobacteria bacterium]|nr:hypothetical protein [Alphaproteobacteria bacterium]